MCACVKGEKENKPKKKPFQILNQVLCILNQPESIMDWVNPKHL